jgi:hypothetical protein
MRSIAVILALGAAVSGVASGAGTRKQTDSPRKTETAAPAPGPEIKRLGELAGTWKLDGQIQKSPMGPGGKTSAISTCAWFDGDFFLVCHAKGTTPMGNTSGMSVLGWDPDHKVYTFSSIDSAGMASTAQGTVDGKTWTWRSEEKMGGKKMKSRFVLVQETPDRNKTSWSISPDGQTWSELYSAIETREKTPPKKKAK